MRAWTLGFPKAYDRAIRMAGNAKQPGGYAFPTREDAQAYVDDNPEEAGNFAPYEIEIDGDSFEAATLNHITTRGGRCRVLRAEARLINPDTGQPA